MKVAIVGGGLMGLVAAHRLASGGHPVTVFEREKQLGGLTTWHDFGDFVWDRFYHVILPSDTHLIEFVKSVGLGERLKWRTTQTGFFVDETLYPLNDALDFLRFPPLSLVDKARLAFTILYCSRIEDWRSLERISVEDWLIRVSGRATYDKLWRPLLLAKLGENYKRVSAVFIWSYIKRMFSARDKAAQKEQLGHVAGGYQSVFTALSDRIHENGGAVRAGVTVQRLQAAAEGVNVTIDNRDEHFDKVIFTSPVNILRKVAGSDLVEIASPKADVEYLGVICVAVVSRQPIMPFYVLNIADARVPFTGVIGMSNVVDTSETAGLHLTYLPKYMLSTDPAFATADDVIVDEFLSGLRTIFPGFDAELIVSVHVNRAAKVQPLQVLNYSELVPRTRTKNKDFYVLNTAQFVNNTLNNNEVIRATKEFFSENGSDFGMREAPSERAAGAAVRV
jgi:protoporphyrinogen oxidase